MNIWRKGWLGCRQVTRKWELVILHGVFIDLEDFSFAVEVVNRGHFHASSGNAEGGVVYGG